jgi:hypothetical protein
MNAREQALIQKRMDFVKSEIHRMKKLPKAQRGSLSLQFRILKTLKTWLHPK